MISSRMLLGQTTSSLRAPAKLSSLHSSNCSLFVLSFRSSPFRISNLEPLFAKHPGGGTPNLCALAWQNLLSSLLLITYMQAPYFHALAHSFAQREACIYPVANNLRTLSIAIGVVPLSLFISSAGVAMTVGPLGARRCDGQLPQSRSWDLLPKRWGRRSHP